MNALDLLPPDCVLGYSRDALEQILAEDYAEFGRWMRGQTAAICDGLAYDHESRKFHETGCGPHGTVVYAHDLDRFLSGLPVID